MDLKQTIRAFVVENFLIDEQSEPLADKASLLDRGALDSTGVLELVAFLEQTFAIEVEIAEMTPANLDSLDAIVAYVQRKQRP
jgi:acyl carrier protein